MLSLDSDFLARGLTGIQPAFWSPIWGNHRTNGMRINYWPGLKTPHPRSNLLQRNRQPCRIVCRKWHDSCINAGHQGRLLWEAYFDQRNNSNSHSQFNPVNPCSITQLNYLQGLEILQKQVRILPERSSSHSIRFLIAGQKVKSSASQLSG